MNLFADIFGGSLFNQNPGWFSYQRQVPAVKKSCQFFSDRTDDDEMDHCSGHDHDQRFYVDRDGQVYEIVEHPWYGTSLLPVKAAPSPARRQKCQAATRQKKKSGNRNTQHETHRNTVQHPKIRQIPIDGFDNPELKVAQETEEEIMSSTEQNEPAFIPEENTMDETHEEDATETQDPAVQTDVDSAMDCNEQDFVHSDRDKLATSQVQRISDCVRDLEQQFHEAMKDMPHKQPEQQQQQFEKMEKEFIKYEELLLQQLLALDSVEIRDDSHPSVREMRKQEVKYVQRVLKQVDEKRATLLLST